MKAADLHSITPIFTIADCNLEIIGEKDENKLVVAFIEINKELVMNATNWTNMEGIYGKNPNDWVGKHVEVFTTWVDFRGKSVEAVRIKPEVPTAAPPEPEPIP